MEKELIEKILTTQQNLEASFEVYRTFPLVLKTIAEKFTKALKEKLEQKYGIENVSITTEIYGDKINLKFRKKTWIDETYCSIKDHQKDRLYLSIETEESKRKEFYAHLMDSLQGTHNDYQWWVYPKKYNNWTQSIDEIRQMNSDDSIQFFLKELSDLIKIIDAYQQVNLQ